MEAYNAIFGTTYSTPIWKDGVWHGSDFNYPGSITNNFIKKILDKTNFRNTLLIGTSSNHIWNIFDNGNDNVSNKILETGKDIYTRQLYYTPTFYDWTLTKSKSNISYPDTANIGTNVKTSYTTSAFNVNTNKSTHLYWEDDLIEGTTVYELTSTKQNLQSIQIKDKSKSEYWINFPTQDVWATPIGSNYTYKLELYKTEPNPSNGPIGLYYSTKQVVNTINNNWKFTFIKLYESGNPGKGTAPDTNYTGIPNVYVYEIGENINTSSVKWKYDPNGKIIDKSVSLNVTQGTSEDNYKGYYYDAFNQPINEINDNPLNIWISISNSQISFISIGTKNCVINKITSTDNKPIPTDYISKNSLWFPPFEFE